MVEKYYTPEIEEFHVGFEYEFKHPDYEIWNKYTTPEFNFEREDCIPFNGNLDNFRVKYLDREDIESFGYILDSLSTKHGNKHRYEMKGKRPEEKWIDVQKDNYKVLSIYTTDGGFNLDGPNYSCKFKGIIKNKSELKKLFQQIGI